jgi:outer membrane immunogenic protein
VKYIQTMTATCFGCAAPFTFSATQTSSTSKTQSGGVFGAGAEYALWNSLSVRAEYLYAQFKGVSTSSALVGPPGTVSNPFTGSTGNLRDHIVRIGLNYKFGGGAVVASY